MRCFRFRLEILTSNVRRVLPFQVLLEAGATGVSIASKAQAEQVRSVSVERLGPVIGRLPVALMSKIDAAPRLHLAL